MRDLAPIHPPLPPGTRVQCSSCGKMASLVWVDLMAPPWTYLCGPCLTQERRSGLCPARGVSELNGTLEHVYVHSGRIPLTGPLACSYCGRLKEAA